jgi:ubiquinone biosynthesis protein UbiJ
VTDAAPGPAAVLADVLADLTNTSLALDPASRARLAALEGRRVQINTTLGPLGQRVFSLTVSAGRLRFYTHPVDAPHVIVQGDPPTLLAWLIGAEEPARRLVIEGDTTVLGELNGVLRSFRPDLGKPLTRVVGADAARTALGTAELVLAGLRSALQGAGHGLRDGAAQTFVDRPRMERLLDDLDDLRLRVDRLGARVAAREQLGATQLP